MVAYGVFRPHFVPPGIVLLGWVVSSALPCPEASNTLRENVSVVRDRQTLAYSAVACRLLLTMSEVFATHHPARMDMVGYAVGTAHLNRSFSNRFFAVRLLKR